MRLLLQWDLLVDTAELALNPLDLIPHGCRLLPIQFRCGRAGDTPLRTAHDGGRHLQVS
jgi:hypothetical protein